MKELKKISYVLLFIAGLFAFMNNGLAAMEACDKYLDITIDQKIAEAVRVIILIIQIVVPVLLVIFGSIDFVKAVVAQKEDEIKKGQQTFIKRVIAALLLFFVVAFVKLAIGFGAGTKRTNILNCVSCFTEGPTSKDCSKVPIDETIVPTEEDEEKTTNEEVSQEETKKDDDPSCKKYRINFINESGKTISCTCFIGTEDSLKEYAKNYMTSATDLKTYTYVEFSNCQNCKENVDTCNKD